MDAEIKDQVEDPQAVQAAMETVLEDQIAEEPQAAQDDELLTYFRVRKYKYWIYATIYNRFDLSTVDKDAIYVLVEYNDDGTVFCMHVQPDVDYKTGTRIDYLKKRSRMRLFLLNPNTMKPYALPYDIPKDEKIYDHKLYSN